MKFDYRLFSQEIQSRITYKDTYESVSQSIGLNKSTINKIIQVNNGLGEGKDLSLRTILAICNWMGLGVDHFTYKD